MLRIEEERIVEEANEFGEALLFNLLSVKDIIVNGIKLYEFLSDINKRYEIVNEQMSHTIAFHLLTSKRRLLFEYLNRDDFYFLNQFQLTDQATFNLINHALNAMSLLVMALKQGHFSENTIKRLLMDECDTLKTVFHQENLIAYSEKLMKIIQFLNRVNLVLLSFNLYFADYIALKSSSKTQQLRVIKPDRVNLLNSRSCLFQLNASIPTQHIPFIPAKIRLDDLDGQNNLYTTQEMKQIEDHCRDISEGLITKFQLMTKGFLRPRRDVVKTQDDTLYAVYGYNPDYQLIEVAQSFNNLKFYSLKLSQDTQSPVHSLVHSGEFIPQRDLRYKAYKQLISGVNLSDYLAKKPIATSRRLHICAMAASMVERLHLQNTINLDLCVSRYWFDEASERLSLVDEESLVTVAEKEDVYVKNKGNQLQYYHAPESARGDFSLASDIYCFGVSILEIMHIGYYCHKKNKVIFYELNQDQSGLAVETREKMIVLIKQMLSDDPDARPDARFVNNTMTGLYFSTLRDNDAKDHVAYVNLDDFINIHDDEIKKEILSALQDKKHIYFVDVDAKHQDKYMRLLQEFAEWGVYVNREVLQPRSHQVRQILGLHMQRLNNRSLVFEYYNNINLLGEVIGSMDVMGPRRFLVG